MTTTAKTYLRKQLKSKVYRDTYVAANLRNGIAAQIRATREARGWSQRELGDRVGMAQETISQLENPEYGKFTLNTLKRLASAFDVALVVRFVAFSNLLEWTTNLSAEDLVVRDFENDVLAVPVTSDRYHVTSVGSDSRTWRAAISSLPLVVDNQTARQTSSEVSYAPYPLEEPISLSA